jgi:GNAT superfamily N-acetyltransferase
VSAEPLVSVRPETDAASSVVDILADAFADDPVMAWVFPEWNDLILPAFFNVFVGAGLLAHGATFLAGEAGAVWVPPGASDVTAAPGFEQTFVAALAGAGAADALDRLLVLGERTGAVHPREPHYYLAFLGTRRSAQGRGAGSQLLRRTLSLVDRASQPAYLEASNPAGVPFYERFGFQVMGRIDLSDGPSLTPMWRPVQI